VPAAQQRTPIAAGSKNANLLAGEGVPYVIDQYRVSSADGGWRARPHELAWAGMLIDFGRSAGHLD
jgi:hypothetical protein